MKISIEHSVKLPKAIHQRMMKIYIRWIDNIHDDKLLSKFCSQNRLTSDLLMAMKITLSKAVETQTTLALLTISEVKQRKALHQKIIIKTLEEANAARKQTMECFNIHADKIIRELDYIQSKVSNFNDEVNEDFAYLEENKNFLWEEDIPTKTILEVGKI